MTGITAMRDKDGNFLDPVAFGEADADEWITMSCASFFAAELKRQKGEND